MQPTPAYDSVADIYHQTIDPDGTGLRDPVFEDLVGDVRDQHVIAVCCGQGRDARRLADLGATVVGVDICEPLLRHARELEQANPRGIRYVLGDAQDLVGFDNSSFAGAVCHMALMDIHDVGRAIGSVARVLRPGGWFVCSIVHPCYAPHVEIVGDYLADRQYDKVGGWHILPDVAYHRPLSTYLNSLADAGLALTRTVEPADGTIPGREVPNLLYLRCEVPSR
jgi:ubiquinone/menaquinone biosynthesis C-methylase UbiE